MIINEIINSIIETNSLQETNSLKKTNSELSNVTNRLDLHLIKEYRNSEKDIYEKIGNYLKIPWINIDVIGYSELCVRKVTSEFISMYKTLPIGETKEVVKVAIADPFILDGVNIIKSIFSKEVNLILTTNEKIQKINNIIYSKLDAYENSTADDEENKSNLEKELLMKDADIMNAPIVKLVDSIFKEAIARNASDIHIEPEEESIRIRYRIDGELYNSQILQNSIYLPFIARIKIIAGLNISERRRPQDGRIKKKINDINIDFRVSTLPTIYGEKIVIRVLDNKVNSFEREDLGFTSDENIAIDRLLKKPYGIILVTGPTGCGKSTTLYSFIQELNKEMVNIITVEDPIEYTIHGVNQVQVNTKIDYTFANILRSILRQDPNIIMIGEIRDEETANIAMRLAITGHLVLSTLHTNDSVGAVMRLLDLGVTSFFLASALNGVIAQRLVRKLCPECKRAHATKKEENDILGITEQIIIYEAQGCPACHKTGYSGRTGIHEIFSVTNEIKELIMKNTQGSRLQGKAIKEGMVDLVSSCKKLVISGVTSMEELLKIIYSKD